MVGYTEVLSYTDTKGPPGPELLKLGPHPRTVQLVWFSIIIAGQTGLFALLCTLLFSKSVTPHSTALLNLLIISFLETTIYLILYVLLLLLLTPH